MNIINNQSMTIMVVIGGAGSCRTGPGVGLSEESRVRRMIPTNEVEPCTVFKHCVETTGTQDITGMEKI